jgi:glutamate 5-kinase
MERYTAEFDRAGRVAGQVLLAGEVFADRNQYLHAKRTLERMVGSGVVPVVNENDAVSLDELRFGDNDRLAALVAHLVGATLLVMLTDTSGLLSADPRFDREARLIDAVRHSDEVLDQVGAGGSGPLGSGGVATKVAAARIAAWSGIPTVVGPAADDTIRAAMAAEPVGTWVDPRPRPLPARKLWIAFGRRSEGSVRIDAGAVRALVEQGRSLLPVGVVEVTGDFDQGAAVDVLDPDGAVVAKGLARLAADDLSLLAGNRGTEAIHRDDLVILTG